MAGRTLWCQATTGLKNYDATDIKWDLPMGTVKEGIRRDTKQGFGWHGALGCSFRLGRKCVIPSELKDVFQRCFNCAVFLCMLMSSFSGCSILSIKERLQQRLSWPLDVGTRNTCQPLVSGRPTSHKACCPVEEQVCYQLPGIRTGSDINLTSKGWKWK